MTDFFLCVLHLIQLYAIYSNFSITHYLLSFCNYPSFSKNFDLLISHNIKIIPQILANFHTQQYLVSAHRKSDWRHLVQTQCPGRFRL